MQEPDYFMWFSKVKGFKMFCLIPRYPEIQKQIQSYISYPSFHADGCHDSPLCRCFRRHSQAALNRQQEMMSHCPALPQLRLLDYLQRRKERKPAPSIDLKISKAGNVSQRQTRFAYLFYFLWWFWVNGFKHGKICETNSLGSER